MLDRGERDSKTDLMRKVKEDEMMLPYMALIRGASFTAHIPIGTRSQDTANTLCIKTGSDGKADSKRSQEHWTAPSMWI